MCSGHAVDANDPKFIEKKNCEIDRVNLVPCYTKIYTGWNLVMVIVISLSEHKDVNWKKIFRRIIHFEIGAAIFMCKPINNSSMDWTNRCMYRDKKVLPRGGSKKNIECSINADPNYMLTDSMQQELLK